MENDSVNENPPIVFRRLSNGKRHIGFSCSPVRWDSHLEACCHVTSNGRELTTPSVEFWAASGWYSTAGARLFAQAMLEICDKADALWNEIKTDPRTGHHD